MVKRVLKVVAGIIVLLVVLIAAYGGYSAAKAPGRLSFADTPYPNIVASKDSALIERGRYLVHGPAHCAQCHSTGDREHPEQITAATPLSGGVDFSMGPIASFHAANLTSDAETGIGKLKDGEIARVVRTGIKHDGTISFFMRFAAARPSDEDLTAIISYLRSLPPVHNEVPAAEWKLLGKMMLPMFPLSVRTDAPPAGVQPGLEPTVARGEYLAEHLALCTSCHTAYDPKTYLDVGPKAGGGSVEPSHGKDHDMEFAAPNLTSDPETGYTGRATEDAFVARIRAARVITSSIMPWEQFKTMTDVDLRSIYRYLHSLPPVKHDNGPTYRKKGSWTPTE